MTPLGLEPRTHALKVRCSHPTELRSLAILFHLLYPEWDSNPQTTDPKSIGFTNICLPRYIFYSSIFICGRGGIRTPWVKRQWIYSPSQLTIVGALPWAIRFTPFIFEDQFQANYHLEVWLNASARDGFEPSTYCFCCLSRTRTRILGTRTLCAAITPKGNINQHSFSSPHPSQWPNWSLVFLRVLYLFRNEHCTYLMLVRNDMLICWWR